jgi:hypothetical protein
VGSLLVCWPIGAELWHYILEEYLHVQHIMLELG